MEDVSWEKMSLCSRFGAIEILWIFWGNGSNIFQLGSRRDLESIADCVTLFIFWLMDLGIIIEVFSYSTQQTKVDWIIRPRVARSHLLSVSCCITHVQSTDRTVLYCMSGWEKTRRPVLCAGQAISVCGGLCSPWCLVWKCDKKHLDWCWRRNLVIILTGLI